MAVATILAHLCPRHRAHAALRARGPPILQHRRPAPLRLPLHLRLRGGACCKAVRQQQARREGWPARQSSGLSCCAALDEQLVWPALAPDATNQRTAPAPSSLWASQECRPAFQIGSANHHRTTNNQKERPLPLARLRGRRAAPLSLAYARYTYPTTHTLLTIHIRDCCAHTFQDQEPRPRVGPPLSRRRRVACTATPHHHRCAPPPATLPTVTPLPMSPPRRRQAL